MKKCILFCALAALPSVRAVETKFWQQSEFSDFEKAKLNKISLRSDGRFFLAPETKEVLDSSTAYLWSAALDSKGNLYTGGGSPSGSSAKLFQIDAAGKSKVIAELEGLEIHAIAVDRQDRVYAATAPDGKVYRIVNGKSEVFFDPKTKYIWALAFAPNGDLFVATGDRGDIFRVTPSGAGSVFFRTEEAHARSLAIDRAGNLIAGTEPGGLILRVTPAGEGFVLYQTPKREVTAVAVASDASIYAAAVGARAASVAPPPTPPIAIPAGPPATAAAKPGGAPPPTFASAPSISGGSDVYRIDPDGAPRRVWTHAQDIAYAIAFDPQGRAVIGTGNKGNVYRIDSSIWNTLLVNLPPTQVTAFASGGHGELFAVTGNIGKVYQIGPSLAKEGSLESEPFDGGAFTYWGRLTFTGPVSGGRVAFESRSGNVNQPQKNWSTWAPVIMKGESGSVTSPAARFLQYRATLSASTNGQSPEVTSIETAYLAKNVAPVVREIEITPANYKFASSAITFNPPSGAQQTITLPAMGQQKRSAVSSIDLSTSISMNYAKGHLGARWSAQDDNGDAMLYRVEIRGVNETQWKLLREKIRDKYISWDSTAFPDGKYVLRVAASDAPSNPPAQALSATLEGDPFLIDNTPPRITGLAGTTSGNRIDIQWKAADALSLIAKAEYSVNGGDWMVAEPVNKLSDASELDYKLSVERPGAGEYTIAVRVTDEYDNQAVEKVVVR